MRTILPTLILSLMSLNALAVELHCRPVRSYSPVTPFVISYAEEHLRGNARIKGTDVYQDGPSRRKGDNVLVTFRSPDNFRFKLLFPKELYMAINGNLAIIPAVLHWEMEGAPMLHKASCRVDRSKP